jgi:hypothetical protein
MIRRVSVDNAIPSTPFTGPTAERWRAILTTDADFGRYAALLPGRLHRVEVAE